MPGAFSVVVTTYNASQHLACVLAGLRRQSVAPLEILVADDGSTEETAQTIEQWRPLLPAPLHHIWHEDAGYRKGTICNKAVLAAQGDYVGFLDGDTIPHRHWVKDHLERSRPTRVLCGRRGRLGPKITPKVTPEFIEARGLEEWFGPVGSSARSRDSRKLARSLRLPFFASWVIGLRPRKLMGCNFSLPRAAFEAVNGYDEEFNRFRREDRDLELRLQNFGMRMVPIINRACVWHLYHPELRVSAELVAERNEMLARIRTRCERGMNAHAGTDDCLLKS